MKVDEQTLYVFLWTWWPEFFLPRGSNSLRRSCMHAYLGYYFLLCEKKFDNVAITKVDPMIMGRLQVESRD